MENKNALVPTTEELNIYQVMAKKATESQMFNKIGGEAGLLSIMLMARELGLPPMQAIMGGMNVIQGKVEISPRLMNTMIRKAGHELQIVESTNAVCKIRGIRKDTNEEYTASFTIEEARVAGLVRSGGGWEKYPSDMLFARCLSRLARRLFADVISSAYVEGEISGDEPLGRSEQLYGKPEQLSGKSVQLEEAEEAEVVKEPEMSVEEFVGKLRERVGDKYGFENMEVYLGHLAETKKVDTQKIKEQALHDALTERFCKGWAKWYDEQIEEKE